jgi:hypothetical protein
MQPWQTNLIPRTQCNRTPMAWLVSCSALCSLLRLLFSLTLAFFFLLALCLLQPLASATVGLSIKNSVLAPPFEYLEHQNILITLNRVSIQQLHLPISSPSFNTSLSLFSASLCFAYPNKPLQCAPFHPSPWLRLPTP